jgi:hypothetical protein
MGTVFALEYSLGFLFGFGDAIAVEVPNFTVRPCDRPSADGSDEVAAVNVPSPHATGDGQACRIE